MLDGLSTVEDGDSVLPFVLQFTPNLRSICGQMIAASLTLSTREREANKVMH